MKKLSKIFAVVLCLALALSMLPFGASAAECHLVEGTAYRISVYGKNGTLWVDGTVTSGRFNASASESDAAAFYVEAVTGGFKLYTKNGETKNYVTIGTSSSSGAFTTTSADATVLTWNSTLNTLVASSNRAFGSKNDSTYSNVSTYSTTNTDGYNWGQFVEYAPVQDTRENLPTSASAIVDAIYALQAGEALNKYYKYDSFTLTGTIVGSVSWADDYNNGELTIKVEGTNKELKAFRFKAGTIAVETIKALVAGDKVTFEVESAKNYNGTYELEYPVLKAVEKAGTNPEGTTATTATTATNGTQNPDDTGDTGIVSMTAVMALAVTALAALVIGNKKRMF